MGLIHVFKEKVNMLYLVWCGEGSRRNIHVRGMEDVRDARFCGVKVLARVRRESYTRVNVFLSFVQRPGIQTTVQATVII